MAINFAASSSDNWGLDVISWDESESNNYYLDNIWDFKLRIQGQWHPVISDFYH